MVSSTLYTDVTGFPRGNSESRLMLEVGVCEYKSLCEKLGLEKCVFIQITVDDVIEINAH